MEIRRINGELIAVGDSVKEACEKSRADLSEANLYNVNLREANLREADLRWADLSGANLSGADLYRANLSEANLYRANLYRANLREADLYRANLSGANLYRANLSGSNLREADLRWADLREADLRWADLRWANLSEANLEFYSFPSCYQLAAIQLGELPDDLTIELMRRDAYGHPHPERFDVWANGGQCPYENEQRAWLFKENAILWKPGNPTMTDRELILAICKAKKWGIHEYLPLGTPITDGVKR